MLDHPELVDYPFEFYGLQTDGALQYKLVQRAAGTKGEKEIICGTGLQDPTATIDFFANVDPKEKGVIMQRSSADVRTRFEDFGSRVPYGVRIIHGPPGCGRSTLIGALAEARAFAGAKLSCVAPSKPAVSVLYRAFVQQLRILNVADAYLVVRACFPQLETEILVEFLENKQTRHDWQTRDSYNRHDRI